MKNDDVKKLISSVRDQTNQLKVFTRTISAINNIPEACREWKFEYKFSPTARQITYSQSNIHSSTTGLSYLFKRVRKAIIHCWKENFRIQIKIIHSLKALQKKLIRANWLTFLDSIRTIQISRQWWQMSLAGPLRIDCQTIISMMKRKTGHLCKIEKELDHGQICLQWKPRKRDTLMVMSNREVIWGENPILIDLRRCENK